VGSSRTIDYCHELFCWPAKEMPARFALVIGNSRYQNLNPLPNAGKDARRIADQLTKLHFDVRFEQDLDNAHFAGVLKTFGESLLAASPNVVSFVFYSGHAAQDAARINYLLPVDSTARNGNEVREQAFPIQVLLDDMSTANNDVNILVIDACRDWFKDDQSVDLPRGLHDMGRHGSVLIALATSPDTTADDGGKNGSPYAARLVEALSIQFNDPISLLLDDVDSKVYFDTDTTQAPEYINGLARTPRWSLIPPSIVTATSVSPPLGKKILTPFLQDLDRGKVLEFASGNVSFADTLLARKDLLEEHGIDTSTRFIYFISTMAYETNFFKYKMEDLKSYNYTASRLMQVFPRIFPTIQEAENYEHSPERLANLIFANRLGNGNEASGDGWRYRGRGLRMVTGRDNYKRLGDAIHVDLEAFPDLMSDPEIGLAVAAAYWSRHNLNPIADERDLLGVTKAITGGTFGVAQRHAILSKARSLFEPLTTP
jgi:putative chitinase